MAIVAGAATARRSSTSNRRSAAMAKPEGMAGGKRGAPKPATKAPPKKKR
jgi:hypothetical protein